MGRVLKFSSHVARRVIFILKKDIDYNEWARQIVNFKSGNPMYVLTNKRKVEGFLVSIRVIHAKSGYFLRHVL